MRTATVSGQKECPVIFKAEMVRAILEDRKTQTRRIIKPQPFPNSVKVGACQSITLDRMCKEHPGYAMFRNEHDSGYEIRCPYGVAGDRLWVRETFEITGSRYQGRRTSLFGRYGGGARFDTLLLPEESERYWKWKKRTGKIPSVFMFRSLSSITLEITEVRVERLQDISADDCVAEGIKMLGIGLNVDVAHLRVQYRQLWDSINGVGAWDKNPWVWVIDFCPAKVE